MKRLGISFAAIVALSIGAAGCSSCKKGQKKLEEVKKDLVEKKKVAETPLPEDALVEVVIKDPESLVKRSADGAGLGPMVGDSPYQKLIDSVTDENAKKALKAIDPHGTFAGLGIAKIAPGEKPHGCAAARLKDPDIAASALSAAAKSGGNMKTWQSKSLEVTVYELGTDAEVAVYGDAVILSDTRDALETGAKYVAWRSLESKVDHELVLRVPMQKIGPTLKTLGTAEWAKVTPKDLGSPKVKAEIDPLVDPVLTAVADMGELLVNVDIKGDALEFDEKLGATKSFSAWLTKYPAGDASPLLSMPKGESVALYRFPDGLGPAIYAGIDYAIESSTLTPAERADASKNVRELGKSFGHQMAYVYDTGKGSGLNTEFLVRIDLDDAAAAKAAIPNLRKLAEKVGGGKASVTPYKKFGAEGETITTGAMIPTPGAGATPTKDSWVWALKGNQLWLSGCLGCTETMLDAALDPASKATLDADPSAKAKIGDFPSKGLITASYGTSFSMPGAMGGLGAFMGVPPSSAPKKPGTAMWGWSTAAADGITAKGAMPLVFLGDLVKGYLAMTMGGMGMGGAPPPF